MTYSIRVIYEGNDPLTGEALPRESEMVSVEANTLDDARRRVPLHTRIDARGRSMRQFYGGTELFGSF